MRLSEIKQNGIEQLKQDFPDIKDNTLSIPSYKINQLIDLIAILSKLDMLTNKDCDLNEMTNTSIEDLIYKYRNINKDPMYKLSKTLNTVNLEFDLDIESICNDFKSFDQSFFSTYLKYKFNIDKIYNNLYEQFCYNIDLDILFNKISNKSDLENKFILDLVYILSNALCYFIATIPNYTKNSFIFDLCGAGRCEAAIPVLNHDDFNYKVKVDPLTYNMHGFVMHKFLNKTSKLNLDLHSFVGEIFYIVLSMGIKIDNIISILNNHIDNTYQQHLHYPINNNTSNKEDEVLNSCIVYLKELIKTQTLHDEDTKEEIFKYLESMQEDLKKKKE